MYELHAARQINSLEKRTFLFGNNAIPLLDLQQSYFASTVFKLRMKNYIEDACVSDSWMVCRSACCSATDKGPGTSVLCTYKQISVIIEEDGSTRAFWLLKCFLSLAFKKAMRFRPISADSQQNSALPGCYLFRTEVQLVSKWICRFFFFAGMSKKAKNQVLTTHSECNNFVFVL